MYAPAASRLMLRHSRFVFRQHGCVRNTSTTSEAAQAASGTAAKSKETVSNIPSKASEGLSRVTSSAGPALNGAAHKVNGVLSRWEDEQGDWFPLLDVSLVNPNLAQVFIIGQLSPPRNSGYR